MTDLSVLSHLPPKNPVASAHTVSQLIGSIGEYSTSTIKQVCDAPSLYQVAKSLLGQGLQNVLPVTNPDIYFINNRTAEGAHVFSLSLTEGLVRTMVYGTDWLNEPGLAVYTRHQTVDPQALLAADTIATVFKLLAALSVSLMSFYSTQINEWWKTGQEFPQSPGKFKSPHHHVAEQQVQSLMSEIQLQRLEGVLDAAEVARLTEVVFFHTGVGVYTPSVLAADGTSVSLQACFVVALEANHKQSLTVENSVGAVFLVTPTAGLERCESLEILNRKLVERMADPERRMELIHTLLLSDQSRFDEGPSPTTDWTPAYFPLIESIFDYRTFFLAHKQLQDLNFLVDQARTTHADLQGFMRKAHDIQCMRDFDEALRAHFLTLLVHQLPKAIPAWLRDADENSGEYFKRLETDRQRAEVALASLLKEVDTLEDFAVDKVSDYIRRHLGYSVDPRQVTITVPDEIELSTGLYRCSYVKSLLEFAMDGLPEPVSATPRSIEIPAQYTNPAFTFEFAQRLINDLDVKHFYHQEVQRVHRQPQTQRALVSLKDRTLALNAFAARLQGHLTDRGFTLIDALRGDRFAEGVQRTIDGLVLSVGKSRFKDMVVFREVTADDEFHVLYAPGGPAGWDLFEFPSWRSLVIEIGSWTKTLAGTQYLIDQTSISGTTDSALFISQTHEKPIHWTADSVEFASVEPENYEQRLGQVVGHKTERYLAGRTSGRLKGVEFTDRDRKDFALLSARINEVKTVFLEMTPLVSYRDFVRAEGGKFLSSHLVNQGINMEVDPDTVYFDLQGQVRDANPDFSQYSNLWRLTDLLMDGFSNRYEFSVKAIKYSSVGQDLSPLSNTLIDDYLRGAALGERYIKAFKDDLFNRHHDNYPKRQALFAKQQQYEMHLAALSEYSIGTLTRGEYNWIVDNIAALDIVTEAHPLPGADARPDFVCPLLLKGWTLEGLYVFKNRSEQEAQWVYTPGAPDGLSFRKTSDVIVSIQRPGMVGYYYDRAPYRGRRVIGTLLDKLARTPYIDGEWVSIDPVNALYQIQNAHQLYGQMIERIMQDVDDRTESSNERLGLLIYTIIRYAGTVLLLPFPPASLAWGLAHAGVDVYRGISAYIEGDRASALPFFTSAYTTALTAPLGVYEIKAGVAIHYPVSGPIKAWATGKLPFSTQWYPVLRGN